MADVMWRRGRTDGQKCFFLSPGLPVIVFSFRPVYIASLRSASASFVCNDIKRLKQYFTNVFISVNPAPSLLPSSFRCLPPTLRMINVAWLFGLAGFPRFEFDLGSGRRK
jgi:hypothetical protein